MLQIEIIVNTPVSSCCYVCFDKDISNSCIIIDPASEDDRIFCFIEQNDLVPEFIILTHEHFDHCLSVNLLRNSFPGIKLICSHDCNDAIQDTKKNCSVFWNNKKRFVLAPADIKTEEIGNHLQWNNRDITFYSVPGHTKGSIAIEIESNLFTGDAYIPGLKTVTKLPGGDKMQAHESDKLIHNLSFGKKIHPGHKIAN